jgi:tRNA(Ile2) C34 agmatinyltransferase TiaS
MKAKKLVYGDVSCPYCGGSSISVGYTEIMGSCDRCGHTAELEKFLSPVLEEVIESLDTDYEYDNEMMGGLEG